ncbi:MAG: hypothetical protein GY950_07300, partial [bacterium]|nr:hypothetical protein [bacterium]
MSDRSAKDILTAAADQNIKERDYWLDRLSGHLETISFPYDVEKSRGEIETGSMEFTFSPELFSRLTTLSKDSDYALNVILNAALVLLLGRYTGKTDIIIGAPIYRQEKHDSFINTVLPLRNTLKDDMTFKNLLMQVKESVVEAGKNQNYPIEILMSQLGVESLFDVAVLLENIHDRDYLRNVNPNMLFSFLRTGEYIRGTVVFNSSLYERPAVENIISRFLYLLEVAVSAPDAELFHIQWLTEAVRKQVVFDFNDTAFSYPEDKTL